MSAKKNARLDIAVSERAKEPGRTSRPGRVSTHNDTTSPPPGQRVSDYLLPGRENAVPLKRLKELLDLDGRTVRLMIRGERLQGTPILADCVSGYYLPGNDHARAASNRRTTCRIREYLRAAEKAPLDGQETIWGGDDT